MLNIRQFLYGTSYLFSNMCICHYVKIFQHAHFVKPILHYHQIKKKINMMLFRYVGKSGAKF